LEARLSEVISVLLIDSGRMTGYSDVWLIVPVCHQLDTVTRIPRAGTKYRIKLSNR